jgi:hypothetical protein
MALIFWVGAPIADALSMASKNVESGNAWAPTPVVQPMTDGIGCWAATGVFANHATSATATNTSRKGKLFLIKELS